MLERAAEHVATRGAGVIAALLLVVVAFGHELGVAVHAPTSRETLSLIVPTNEGLRPRAPIRTRTLALNPRYMVRELAEQ